MAYVYERVGADEIRNKPPTTVRSRATVILYSTPSALPDESDAEQTDEREGNEKLIQVPNLPDPEPSSAETLGKRVKTLIPNPADRIKLDDLVLRPFDPA